MFDLLRSTENQLAHSHPFRLVVSFCWCFRLQRHSYNITMKQPWRASNHPNPLGQIIQKVSCLNKLATAHSEFGRRNMLYGNVLTCEHLLTGLFADSNHSSNDDNLKRISR